MDMKRKTVYIAAPLFNKAERDYNIHVRKSLQPWLDVYLPQLDGSLLPNLIMSGMSPAAARQHIFNEDVNAVRRSDVLLIVLNGRTIDEGAAFELGLAWSLGKTCLGLKDDFRQLVSDGDNPMIEGALQCVLNSLDEVSSWAKDFSKNSN